MKNDSLNQASSNNTIAHKTTKASHKKKKKKTKPSQKESNVNSLPTKQALEKRIEKINNQNTPFQQFSLPQDIPLQLKPLEPLQSQNPSVSTLPNFPELTEKELEIFHSFFSTAIIQ